jgi:hypothetical protein
MNVPFLPRVTASLIDTSPAMLTGGALTGFRRNAQIDWW